jgi:hypothetical protein
VKQTKRDDKDLFRRVVIDEWVWGMVVVKNDDDDGDEQVDFQLGQKGCHEYKWSMLSCSTDPELG